MRFRFYFSSCFCPAICISLTSSICSCFDLRLEACFSLWSEFSLRLKRVTLSYIDESNPAYSSLKLSPIFFVPLIDFYIAIDSRSIFANFRILKIVLRKVLFRAKYYIKHFKFRILDIKIESSILCYWFCGSCWDFLAAEISTRKPP